MAEINYEFEYLFSKTGFNRSLIHFKTVSSLLSSFEENINLADMINNLLAEKKLEQIQIAPIVSALLVDKYRYSHVSYNMESTLESFDDLCSEVKGWNAVDIVITYQHPELGICLINPKNLSHWEAIQSLKKFELVTIYVGEFAKTKDDRRDVYSLAIDQILTYFKSGKLKSSEKLTKGFCKYIPYEKVEPRPELKAKAGKPQKTQTAKKGKKGAQAAKEVPTAAAASPAVSVQPELQAAPPRPKRMTPLYSVPVTNELFHNGNVEAWKKIILSYTTKHPGLEVYIYYDGERIHDIHSIFKWGKVKHGSTILFAVGGDDIQDVAKLQRYLRQGASPKFEDFLRFPVNKVLNLF